MNFGLSAHTGFRRRVLKTKDGGAYLVNAVEVRALVRGLAVQREIVFCGDGHLYFQRTLPSRVSSTMIPESASFWRISSERLKSRRFLAALRSSISCFDFFGGQARFFGAEAELAKFLVVVIGEHGENRVKLFHGRDHEGRVLLQEFAAVHGGVHVADQIENGRQREGSVQIVGEAGIEIFASASSARLPFRDWSPAGIVRFSGAPQNCAGARRSWRPAASRRR